MSILGKRVPVHAFVALTKNVDENKDSNPIHPRLAYWRAKPIQLLRAHFTAEIPIKTKAFKLAKLVFEKEQSLQNSDEFGFKNGAYFPNENEGNVIIEDDIAVSDEEDEDSDDEEDNAEESSVSSVDSSESSSVSSVLSSESSESSSESLE